ncbi:YrdB family protein [Alicyclobacillus fastidiosus]|uniref:YrdB family protein n=1 Tax=Alicyclobacillus fastidiosus TaxID=392011 RepID=UPI0023E94436|nr:YrdB family protein [Alicyclobacillus fastidiosus]GMA65997.1 hypothetical protein GCM10025859_64390 [Alicyclobacillus fastidiosus]
MTKGIGSLIALTDRKLQKYYSRVTKMSVQFSKVSNSALSFFVELCALIALSYWGIHIGTTGLLKITFGILVPLVTAFVWGIFLAPKSSKRLYGWMNVCLKLLVFGLSVVALWVTGLHSIAVILGSIVIVNRFLSYVWGQQ